MMCGSGSQEGVQDADAAPLRITKSTFLEFDDGSDREVVVGIEFDIVASLNLSFRKAALLPSDNTCSSEVHVTLAADGGPVRRTTLTVFTLTVSTSLMQTGRTPLIPILYLLSGEHAIHGAIGDRLRDRLKVALRASYYVPVRSSGSTTTTFRLKLPFIVRLCGDFAMLCIFLTLTAGSDVHRCPSWWLCAPNRYMSGRLWLNEHVGEVRHAEHCQGTGSCHLDICPVVRVERTAAGALLAAFCRGSVTAATLLWLGPRLLSTCHAQSPLASDLANELRRFSLALRTRRRRTFSSYYDDFWAVPAATRCSATFRLSCNHLSYTLQARSRRVWCGSSSLFSPPQSKMSLASASSRFSAAAIWAACTSESSAALLLMCGRRVRSGGTVGRSRCSTAATEPAAVGVLETSYRDILGPREGVRCRSAAADGIYFVVLVRRIEAL